MTFLSHENSCHCTDVSPSAIASLLFSSAFSKRPISSIVSILNSTSCVLFRRRSVIIACGSSMTQSMTNRYNDTLRDRHSHCFLTESSYVRAGSPLIDQRENACWLHNGVGLRPHHAQQRLLCRATVNTLHGLYLVHPIVSRQACLGALSRRQVYLSGMLSRQVEWRSWGLPGSSVP